MSVSFHPETLASLPWLRQCLNALTMGPAAWHALDISASCPAYLSAMQAAASRVGAPLGHDFCVISLSDRLKPWEIVVKRLEASASRRLLRLQSTIPFRPSGYGNSRKREPYLHKAPFP